MDIEHLSKVQIVLLTLLVSFVTSIATGIVTVSLMDQAPPAVEQTVNRVVEHTVQTVVPQSQPAAAVSSQDKPPMQQSLPQAIGKAEPSVVRVYAPGEGGAFLGLGVVVDASGQIATDLSALNQNSAVAVELADGTQVRASVVSTDTSTGVALLSATSTGTSTPAWVPATIVGGHPALGDTIVSFYGDSIVHIGDGIVTAIVPPADPTPLIVDTGIASGAIAPGSPLFDISGDLVGMSTGVSRDVSPSGFVPGSVLMTPPPAAGAAK